MELRLGVRLAANADDARQLTAPAFGEQRDVAAQAKALWDYLGQDAATYGGRFLRYSNVYWQRMGQGEEAEADLIAQLGFNDQEKAQEFFKAAKLSDYGRDPRISPSDAWAPIGADAGVFGDRAAAHALIGAAALPDTPRGAGVNVVIIDMGVEAGWIRAEQRRRGADPQPRVNGWSRYDWVKGKRVWRNAGSRPTSPHGHMIARNVLAIAPHATIWDAPLIGDGNRPPSLSTATAILNRIRAFKRGEKFNGWIEEGAGDTPGALKSRDHRDSLVANARKQPWVLVNAWGVFDTGPSVRGLGEDVLHHFNYGADRRHFLTNDVDGLEAADIDVVFCAGNCGEPCPDRRCGPGECGPGRSILGLNCHPDVLTVGAVRVDGVPVGHSAQGPGRLLKGWGRDETHKKDRARDKPDLCAPSHFREVDDAGWLNKGTSAAAGVAAGVIAALRSVKGAHALKPVAMRALLRDSAGRKRWDPRLGYGVINAKAALELMKLRHNIP